MNIFEHILNNEYIILNGNNILKIINLKLLIIYHKNFFKIYYIKNEFFKLFTTKCQFLIQNFKF